MVMERSQVSQRKVNEAIKAYQDAQAAYKKASAENSNLSAAYGYASAYSAMKEAFKKSGLNTTQRGRTDKAAPDVCNRSCKISCHK